MFFPDDDRVELIVSALVRGRFLNPDCTYLGLSERIMGGDEGTFLDWLSFVHETTELAVQRVEMKTTRTVVFSYGEEIQMNESARPDALFHQAKNPIIPSDRDSDGGSSDEGSRPVRLDWKNVLLAVEHKGSDGLLSQARVQMLDRARRMIAAQPNRTHCWGLTIIGTEMLVTYYDRIGAKETVRFNMWQSLRPLLRLIVGLCTASDSAMGFSSAYRQQGRSFTTDISGQRGRLRVCGIRTLRGATELMGRGTVLYTGQLHRRPVVIKESLQDPSRMHEGRVIQQIHAASEGGHMQHIPTVIDYEADQDILPPGAWRLHDIKYARTPECLAIALHGVLEAIKACIRAGIIHCDISEGNIMTDSDGTKGYLVDFDLAREYPHRHDEVWRNGTLIFMSIRLLGNNDASNRHTDDLESVFWVLVWLTMSYRAPGRYDKGHSLALWRLLSAHEIAHQKERLLSRFNVRLARDVQEWYAPLTPLLSEWKTILFSTDGGDDLSLATRMQSAIDVARQGLVQGGMVYGGMLRKENGRLCFLLEESD
ncbi:hypothetical protein KEM52_002433 [Ascosphaera acerosa]|nr:hypothetical protein KEM52_002433 [Ascosphaera acerosa]